MDNGTYSYTYDSRSNMTSQTFVNTGQTVNQTTYYTHSVDDRLTGYTVEDNTTTPPTEIESVNYTYDDAGCMLSKAVTAGGNTDTTTYTYYDDLRIDTVTLPDSSTVTFTYHADGSRATKTTDTEYIEYHYVGGLVKEVHMDESNHSTVLFTVHYQPSRMIIDPGSTGGGDEVEYYPVTDVQGTVYKLLDSSGVEVASYTYSPFGQRLTNTSLTTPPSTPPYMPLGFGGTYSDDDIGLLYAKSRYYDPHTTRFTTKDSYRGSKGSIISQNRYIYCHQNPILYADPAGYAPVEGDHADPCTTTDQDIHYEPDSSDLLPPEDLPNIPQEPIWEESGKTDEEGNPTFVPEGFDVNDDGSFTINIAGLNIRVTVTMDGNGNMDIEFDAVEGDNGYFYYEEAASIAQGLNEAFDVLPNNIVQKILHSGKTFIGFTNVINSYYDNHYKEFYLSYGKGSSVFNAEDLGNFFYSATIGYGIALTLSDITGNEDMQSYAKRLGFDSAFELVMTHGFWATFHHMSVKNGKRTSTLPFYGDGSINEPTAAVGLVEYTRSTMLLQLFLTNQGKGWEDYINKYKNAGSDEERANVVTQVLSSLGTAGGLASLIIGVSNPVTGTLIGLSALAFSIVSLLIAPFGGSNPYKMNNDLGLTVGMYKELKGDGLNWQSIVGIGIYDLNSSFISIGTMSHYISYTMNSHYPDGGYLMGELVYNGMCAYLSDAIKTGPGGMKYKDLDLMTEDLVMLFFGMSEANFEEAMGWNDEDL